MESATRVTGMIVITVASLWLVVLAYWQLRLRRALRLPKGCKNHGIGIGPKCPHCQGTLGYDERGLFSNAGNPTAVAPQTRAAHAGGLPSVPNPRP